jgi:hypothetical protein
MDEREDQEIVEGDSASIILTPLKRMRTAPVLPPVPKPEEFYNISEEDALSKEQRKKKLEVSIAAAINMSKNKNFPEDVRKRFLEKIKGYKKELFSL